MGVRGNSLIRDEEKSSRRLQLSQQFPGIMQQARADLNGIGTRAKPHFNDVVDRCQNKLDGWGSKYREKTSTEAGRTVWFCRLGRLAGDALHVVLGHRDLPAESGMNSHVFQMRASFGVLMQGLGDGGLFVWIQMVVLFRPNG